MNKYREFEIWMDKHFSSDLPVGTKAINFNLYEEEDTQFDIQCIGSPEYDPEDSDWACNEIFSTGEDLFHLESDSWETCLQMAIDYIKEYMSSGIYSSKLTNMEAVTVGFVDGDLEVVSCTQNHD